MGLFPNAHPQQNPIFPARRTPQTSMLQQMQAIRQMMGGNPEAFAIRMMAENPELARQFNDFMSEHKGQTPAQVLRGSGIDPTSIGM